MSNRQIEKLIINSPYEEPTSFWQYVRDTREFSQEPGRRPAGYVIATPGTIPGTNSGDSLGTNSGDSLLISFDSRKLGEYPASRLFNLPGRIKEHSGSSSRDADKNSIGKTVHLSGEVIKTA